MHANQKPEPVKRIRAKPYATNEEETTAPNVARMTT